MQVNTYNYNYYLKNYNDQTKDFLNANHLKQYALALIFYKQSPTIVLIWEINTKILELLFDTTLKFHNLYYLGKNKALHCNKGKKNALMVNFFSFF